MKGVKKGGPPALSIHKPLTFLQCSPPRHQAPLQAQQFKSKPVNRQAWQGPHPSPCSSLLAGHEHCSGLSSTGIHLRGSTRSSVGSTRLAVLGSLVHSSGRGVWGDYARRVRREQVGEATLHWRAIIRFLRGICCDLKNPQVKVPRNNLLVFLHNQPRSSSWQNQHHF